MYLLACQVGVTVGDSALCCYVHVMSFECELTPLFLDAIGRFSEAGLHE